ncbi:unnamed protein product [Aphanomyces euteiches]
MASLYAKSPSLWMMTPNPVLLSCTKTKRTTWCPSIYCGQEKDQGDTGKEQPKEEQLPPPTFPPSQVELTDLLPEFQPDQEEPRVPIEKSQELHLPHESYTKVKRQFIPNITITPTPSNTELHRATHSTADNSETSSWAVPVFKRCAVLASGESETLPADDDAVLEVDEGSPYPLSQHIPYSNWSKTL